MCITITCADFSPHWHWSASFSSYAKLICPRCYVTVRCVSSSILFRLRLHKQENKSFLLSHARLVTAKSPPHHGILSKRRVFGVQLQSFATHLCWQGSLINSHHVSELQQRPRGADKCHLITLFFIVPLFYSLLLSGGDAMTTEMQEIAITEDKPLLTGQADAKVRHTCTSLMHARM